MCSCSRAEFTRDLMNKAYIYEVELALRTDSSELSTTKSSISYPCLRRLGEATESSTSSSDDDTSSAAGNGFTLRKSIMSVCAAVATWLRYSAHDIGWK